MIKLCTCMNMWHSQWLVDVEISSAEEVGRGAGDGVAMLLFSLSK